MGAELNAVIPILAHTAAAAHHLQNVPFAVFWIRQYQLIVLPMKSGRGSERLRSAVQPCERRDRSPAFQAFAPGVVQT